MKKKQEKTQMATNNSRPARTGATQTKVAGKGKWTRLGTLRKRTNAAGVEIPYIVINKNIKLVDRESGNEINLGKYLQVNLVNPEKGLDALKNGGFIDEAKYEEQLQFIADKNIKFELTVPPVDDSNQ